MKRVPFFFPQMGSRSRNDRMDSGSRNVWCSRFWSVVFLWSTVNPEKIVVLLIISSSA